MKTSEEVLKRFHVSENLGLTQEEVRNNRKKYGINGKLLPQHLSVVYNTGTVKFKNLLVI